MTSRKLRFAIFGNLYQPEKSAAVSQLLVALRHRQAAVSIERDYHHFLQAHRLISGDESCTLFDGDGFEADFVISLGGDGTFLRAASIVGSRQVPILGVNMGRLGFLADIRPDEVVRCVQALYEGDYTVEERALLQVLADGKPLAGGSCALNDVAILKHDNASMIAVRATVNGDYLTTYQADGLVVSTPTGSTAYSLSNGGPIIVPGTRVFSMTAVAPHSLNIRPIVIPDDAEVALQVESRSHSFLIALDGRSSSCQEGVRLTVRRAPYHVRVVKRAGQTYFHTLREKMMWGADSRG